MHLTASQLSVATATFEPDQLLVDKWHLPSQALDLTSTADSLCLQLLILQTFLSPAAPNSLRSEGEHCLGLLRFLAGQIDCLHGDFSTLVTQAQDSRSSLRRGAGLLFAEFCAPAN